MIITPVPDEDPNKKSMVLPIHTDIHLRNNEDDRLNRILSDFQYCRVNGIKTIVKYVKTPNITETETVKVAHQDVVLTEAQIPARVLLTHGLPGVTWNNKQISSHPKARSIRPGQSLKFYLKRPKAYTAIPLGTEPQSILLRVNDIRTPNVKNIDWGGIHIGADIEDLIIGQHGEQRIQWKPAVFEITNYVYMSFWSMNP